ncbi:MAG: T9SS type A sorting domain-containing protein [Bacteroidales bacterium]|nr:T9SS type A sorting domain-containing protein [Bacteroidales bacterium]
MKNKKLILSVAILLGIGLTGLQAQTMYVVESGGEQTSYALSNIRKLTFEDENVTVNQIGGTSITYEVANLRYLSFDDYTGVFETEQTTFELNSFPNPVNDILNIDLSGAKNLNSTVSIFSLEGKLLQTKQISEARIIYFDVSSLPAGMYICRYSNETEAKTVKIIKQ